MFIDVILPLKPEFPVDFQLPRLMKPEGRSAFWVSAIPCSSPARARSSCKTWAPSFSYSAWWFVCCPLRRIRGGRAIVAGFAKPGVLETSTCTEGYNVGPLFDSVRLLYNYNFTFGFKVVATDRVKSQLMTSGPHIHWRCIIV